MSLTGVKSNIVQSIRAFTVPYLHSMANEAGQRFVAVNLGSAHSRDDVVRLIFKQLECPSDGPLGFDALSSQMTDVLFKAGNATGFIVVLEQIPLDSKFDKEDRESLLDIFREAADYWGDRKVPFRCFYSFSVATRSASSADDSKSENFSGKLADVSEQALRMSSPFNAGYWLAAAAKQEEAATA